MASRYVGMGNAKADHPQAEIGLREEIREEAEKTVQALKGIGDGNSKAWSEIRDKYLD